MWVTLVSDFWSRNSTVGEVARKVMGDVPISYIEGAGGTRVSEDEIVAVGKHDVSSPYKLSLRVIADKGLLDRFYLSKLGDRSDNNNACGNAKGNI